MRIAVLLSALAAAGLLLTGCAVGGSSTTTLTVTTTAAGPTGPNKPPAAEAETAYVKYFGIPVYARKLDAKRYVIAIKPENFLVGVTANVAFAASHGNACQPLECQPVEDDRYVVPAGKQNLLFILPAATTGTLLHGGESTGHTATAAQLVKHVTDVNYFGSSLASGVWFTVHVDTVTSFAQQFQP